MSLTAAENEAEIEADREINKRLDEMQTIVQPGNMNLVRWKISTYLERDPKTTEEMLGRMVRYFPLIEEKLRAARMPEDLKFLPIIESSLRPDAVSHMGAVGLWQFMYYTGRENGLRINGVVDERRDPLAATDAAIEYLSSLYERFGDWTLAIAAYNSGPGRVERAIRYSNSRNFWDLMRFLPRETRQYIPKYLAAAYLCKHYGEHGLEPDWPSLDLQLTDELIVHQTLSLYKVSEWTGLSYREIRTLNPGFKRGYIPASSRGYRLVLPERVIPLVVVRLKGGHAEELAGEQSYIEAVYQVRPGESLEQIARIFQLNPSRLKYWNHLTEKSLYAGQELTLYLEHSRHNEWLVEDRARIAVESLEARPLAKVSRSPFPNDTETYVVAGYSEAVLNRESVVVRRGQSLREWAVKRGIRPVDEWDEWIRKVQYGNGPPGLSVHRAWSLKKE